MNSFVLPGVGYLYVGRRRVFGAGLILISIMEIYYSFLITVPDWAWAVSGAFAVLLAYDAFTDAQDANNGAAGSS